MQHLVYRLLLLIVLFGSLSGCEIINPDEDTPSFIRIEKPVFVGQGGHEQSHVIVDGWVFVENGGKRKFLGLYQLPARIPVLESGTAKIRVSAGINSDGQKNYHAIYPFYTEYEQEVTLTPGQTATVNPVYEYKPASIFALDADFETSSPFADQTGLYQLNSVSTVAGQPYDSLAYSEGGDRIGLLLSKPDTLTTIRLSTNEGFDLPQGGADVFLEISYRSTMNFSVGVKSNLPAGYSRADLLVFKSREWKKLYVNLTDEVSTANTANARFDLTLVANPGKSGKDYLAIDNVRLLHF